MDQRIVRDALIVFVSALAQGAGLTRFEGVAINIVLVLMVWYACTVRSIPKYMLLVLCAVYGLAPGIPWSNEVMFFGAVMVGIYILHDALPLRREAAYGTLLLVATLVLYAALEVKFITHAPVLLVRELIYTGALAIGLAWYGWYGYERRSGY